MWQGGREGVGKEWIRFLVCCGRRLLWLAAAESLFPNGLSLIYFWKLVPSHQVPRHQSHPNQSRFPINSISNFLLVTFFVLLLSPFLLNYIHLLSRLCFQRSSSRMHC